MPIERASDIIVECAAELRFVKRTEKVILIGPAHAG